MKTAKTVVILLSALAVTACASSGESANTADGIDAFKDDARLGEPVNEICFNRQIDGFSDARRKTVILSTGVSKDYIVEVKGLCHNLDFAQSISVDASLSCVRRGDSLIVSDSAFGPDNGAGLGTDRCYINRIHKWDKKAESAENEP